jgi:hypothetical protein
MRARTKVRGGKGKKRIVFSPQRRKGERKRSPESEGTAITTNAFSATDADNDIISSKEIIGIREGPTRCEACNTDFASHEDFERHAIEDHPDIPARISE